MSFRGPTALGNRREELEDTLEDWILLGISEHHVLPVVDGIDLTIKEIA